MVHRTLGVRPSGAAVVIVTWGIIALGFAPPASALQKVYVDFDSVKDAYDADPGTPGLPPADEIYDYSVAQRGMILGYLNMRYAAYGMEFLEGPKPVPFADSQVTLNGGFGAGAEKVDFRNQDHDDGAGVNTVSIFKFLGKDAILDPWTDDDVVMGTANLIAHEAEHLMGVRHHDALEPIGFGLGGGILPGEFSPGYPGPSGAGDTGDTVSSQHAGGSLSFGALVTPKYVSERAVVRLAMAETFIGDTFLTAEAGPTNHSVPDAQPVPTPGFVLPYPLRPPVPPGDPIPVMLTGVAATVTGMLDDIPGPPPGYFSDYFKFSGTAGQHWTIEAMSYILEAGDRYGDNADVAVLILSDTGVLLPYHSSVAVNDDDDDGLLGATLIDFILPYTGDFVVEVVAAGPFTNTFTGGAKTGLDGGFYELYLYSASVVTVTVPTPSSAAMLAALGGATLLRRRRPIMPG